MDQSDWWVSSVWGHLTSDRLLGPLIDKLQFPIDVTASQEISIKRSDGDDHIMAWGTCQSRIFINDQEAYDKYEEGDGAMYPAVELSGHDLTLYSRLFDKHLGQIGKIIAKVINFLNFRVAKLKNVEEHAKQAALPKKYEKALMDYLARIVAVRLSITVGHEIMHALQIEKDYRDSVRLGKGVGTFSSIDDYNDNGLKEKEELIVRKYDAKWLRSQQLKQEVEQIILFMQTMMSELIDLYFPDDGPEKSKAVSTARSLVNEIEKIIKRQLKSEVVEARNMIAAAMERKPIEVPDIVIDGGD